MQSDGKRFCGDVVLDNFNMVYTQQAQKQCFYTKTMKSKYLGIFIIKILSFEVVEEKKYLKKYST